jgi:hypothetical protein
MLNRRAVKQLAIDWDIAIAFGILLGWQAAEGLAK